MKSLTTTQRAYRSKGKKFNEWRWTSKNTLAGRTIYKPKNN
jgi:hypothetical protein